MTTGRHRSGHARPDEADRSITTTDETGTASDAVDPDWIDAAEADTSSDEHNRDAGASPEVQGVPETADESTPGTGEVPEPERPVVPTDEPTGSLAYGTTAREQADRERLENQLAAEEPDVDDEGAAGEPDLTEAEAAADEASEDPAERVAEERATEQRPERPDVGGPGIHVEDEPR